jgi:hypothetical protein
MEHNSILDQNLSDELELTPSVLITLKKTFKWGKILAVTLYISSGLMIFSFLKLATAETRSSAGGGQSFLIALFLAFIICTFFSAFNLMGFANRGLLSLETNNNKIFSVCIESLNGYFKFFGFFVAIIVLFFGAFFLLAFLAFFN